MADIEDLIQRLREWGRRWPDEEALSTQLAELAAELDARHAYRLQVEAERERLRADRDEYARVALVGLSGLVPTPEKGYVADGGPGQLAADLRAMRAEVERLRAAEREIEGRG